MYACMLTHTNLFQSAAVVFFQSKKLQISLDNKDKNLLNKESEIIFKCHHQKKCQVINLTSRKSTLLREFHGYEYVCIHV